MQVEQMKSRFTAETENVLFQAVRAIANYLQDSQNLEGKPVNYRSANYLKEKLNLSLPENGAALTELIPVIESYLEHSVRTSSQKFFNQLWGGFDLPGLLAEMTTSAANTSMYTYEVAPVATLMEMELVETLNRLIGFHAGEGIMVTGGSNANLIGMLCARNKFVPEAKNRGLGKDNLVVFISDRAHYSFLKAANIIGIGMENVVKVGSDADGRMNPARLEVAIEQSSKEGKIPFFVGATAGTTVIGAFDPLRAIAEITNKWGLWLHVDGAWGAPVLFSKKHQHLLDGSELADSFAWDAHKLMGVPLICSFVLLKQKETLRETGSVGGTDYIFHEGENQDYNLGTMSLQCGRKVDAFKLWLAWQYYGTKGYEMRVNSLFELARYGAEWVRNSQELELLVEPEFLNICFRYHPRNLQVDDTALDRINLQLRDRLIRDGTALVNYAQYQGKTVIRLILTNPAIEKADLDFFFQNLIAAGQACESGKDEG